MLINDRDDVDALMLNNDSDDFDVFVLSTTEMMLRRWCWTTTVMMLVRIVDVLMLIIDSNVDALMFNNDNKHYVEALMLNNEAFVAVYDADNHYYLNRYYSLDTS